MTHYVCPPCISSALTNVALNKPATQSTLHPTYGRPGKAVDGNKGTHISQCTHTADVDSSPVRWWRVDLQGLFEIHAVVITNRGDCCGQYTVILNVDCQIRLSSCRAPFT